MFTKRTIKPYVTVDHVDTATEALAVSLNEKGCVDLGFMASLMGGSEKIEQIRRDLTGVIFKDPDSGDDPFVGWQSANEYLSSNVRVKLAQAKAAAEKNPDYTVNVQALENVQPKELGAGEIHVRLGAAWIPEKVVEQFIFELLQPPQSYQRKIEVCYAKVSGEWNISAKHIDHNNIRNTQKYGTQRINAYELIEDTLNLRTVRIFDIKKENGKEVRTFNSKETAIALDKQEQIKQAFEEWIWKDPERREQLCNIYNEKFNSIRAREYDGSHLTFPGMNPEITLRPHQLNAIARAVYGGNALFAHVVGAGKSFEMIAAAMKCKQIGLIHKALFVVPNHIIGDFSADFLRLYPGANVLMTTKKDFEKKKRKKFCARIATGDYDAVIIGHSQFEKIPISLERQQNSIHKQVDEITEALEQLAKEKENKFTIKQMEKVKFRLLAKLKQLNDSSKKDDIMNFEELFKDF